MGRAQLVLRDGRRIVHVWGRLTQTINICTAAGRVGEYEQIYRLPMSEGILAADISERADVGALAEFLTSHGGVPEGSGGRAGARLWPLVDHDVDAGWLRSVARAVDQVLDDVVDEFLVKPYQHRVEHSLHAEIFLRLKQQAALRGEAALKSGEVTQLVHKEWPETRVDARAGSSGKRGAFDLAVLAPEQIEKATLQQFREGRLAAPIVLEVGLDCGLKHLEQDAEKLLNSKVQLPYLLHLSRIPDVNSAAIESFLTDLPAPLRAAYVHHDPRTGQTACKRLADASPKRLERST